MSLLKKYWHLILSFLVFSVFIYYYFKLVTPDYNQSLKNFQTEFKSIELRAKKTLDSICFFIKQKNFKKVKKYIEKNEIIDIHIFKKDSLVFWNTNQTPISRFVDIQFPSNGLLKLQNGWYYTRSQGVSDNIVSCSFLIKNEFLVVNEYLKNQFNHIFNFPFKASIFVDKEIGFPIFSENNKYLFSIKADQEIFFTDYQSNQFLFLWLIFLFFAFYGVLQLLIKTKLLTSLWLLVFICIFYFLLIYFISNNIHFIRFVDPTLYAFSNLIPNLFVLVSHVLFLLFLLLFFKRFALKYDNYKIKSILKFSFIILNFFVAYQLVAISNSLVKDSSIPLEINKLFQLNIYSFWVILTMGLLVLLYIFFVRLTSLLISETQHKKLSVFLLLIANILFFIYLKFILDSTILIAVFPAVFLSIAVFQIHVRSKNPITYILMYLFFSSFLISHIVNEAYHDKESSERQLFANQLATEQDISTEVKFALLKNDIANHPFFDKFFDQTKIIRSKELKGFMDKTFFKDFWERYEIDYILYNPRSKKTITSMSNYDLSVADIQNVITKHSIPSEINSNLYYVKDYVSQLSYISKIKIESTYKQASFILYAVYKSKRIPEKIGFPKLLVSQNANVLKVLESYSLAKYYHRKLVSQNGDFSYPNNYKILLKNYNKKTTYYNYDGYDHLIIRKNDNDLIVLSKKEHTVFQQLTSFSYLCCFNGFFLFFFLGLRKCTNLKKIALSFASKIQFTLISVVLISLIAYGFGSGMFVKQQYDEYANKLIKEKIQSIKSEFNAKISSKKQLSMETDGELITDILFKLASVFSTDINMYEPDGYLIATSRQKLFNLGLVSEQINPEAHRLIRRFGNSDLVQKENIGNLNYLSAYFPIYNKQSKLICYVNLQYFDQQLGYIIQIEKFIVAIINIFVLLLILSTLIALMVSNWLTSPLRILEENLANVQMGKYNDPILYSSNDEIGSLVKNYNQKLNELAVTANKLAQSEREFAWREMAKQVAHEIKNPLTPMKLSLQHLQRIYDPNDPLSNHKLNMIINSLTEQIDTLSQIANEFSNFAKLPKEHMEIIDLVSILKNVVVIYQGQNELGIELICEIEHAQIKGDKSLLLQVFNNLITNAVQAISYVNSDGFLKISLNDEGDYFMIIFDDNGVGIPDEIKSKLFEPNFTTKNTGSGLGLALSKQIIEVHDGKIWYESQKNSSTKFFIKLPKNDKFCN